jgi:hypothetical protein
MPQYMYQNEPPCSCMPLHLFLFYQRNNQSRFNLAQSPFLFFLRNYCRNILGQKVIKYVVSKGLALGKSSRECQNT